MRKVSGKEILCFYINHTAPQFIFFTNRVGLALLVILKCNDDWWWCVRACVCVYNVNVYIYIKFRYCNDLAGDITMSSHY